MQITCHGAAGFVTGSCHLVETSASRFLIDCGMYQGSKEMNRLNYEPFAFDPATIDFVINTHGHIDHCGLLPKLVKHGFKGTIYASPPTADLLPIMLQDSAFIQEKDTEHENRRRLRKGQEPRQPLYTIEDVEHTISLIQVIEYDTSMKTDDATTFRLRDAGHVIGSAIVELFIDDDGTEVKVVFSGDLGQWDVPIVEDPTYIWNGNYVFIESTYGDRIHHREEPRKSVLFDYIKRTCERGGKLLIPSFALERTQELLYTLSELKQERQDFPPVNIYLDSPLAIKITEVFINHPDHYDEEARSRTDQPFDFPGLIFTPSVDESRRVNELDEPAIVIAGSGMCNAGRIRHHLKHGIWDPRNTVLFVGYQAPGTLGRVLLDGAKEIKMMGDTFVVKAEIARIGSFSAHADQHELTTWLTSFREKPKTVFLIHGEQETLESFSARLNEQGFTTRIPEKGVALFDD
ncbi:MAG: MBL fold metallo-hydrolase [Desulfofustis sp.]|jgi:metallo-beta-lactamase family protein|nr:MBL fold metallo-hydrolase [Desulfofustis sp.]